MVYGIKLTASPPSTSNLVTGFPLTNPVKQSLQMLSLLIFWLLKDRLSRFQC
jgi:hypothetical protein